MQRDEHYQVQPYKQAQKNEPLEVGGAQGNSDRAFVKEVTTTDNTLSLDNADILYSYGKKKHDKITLVINSLFYLFFQIIYIINLTTVSDLRISFSEFTILNYTITLIYLIVSIIYNIKGPEKSSFLYTANKYLHLVSFCAEGVVVIFYWAILASDAISNYDTTCKYPDWCLFHTFISHGAILLPSWLELIFQYTDLGPFDFWLPVAWGVFYLAFINVPVTLFYETIYSALTWDDVTSFVYAGAAVVLCIVVFYIGYGISYLNTRKLRKGGK